MASRIVYDSIWMSSYLARLREERALINEILCALNAARNSVDITSLPQILVIQQDMEQMKRELSKTIDALEEYQYRADYASRVLIQSVRQIELPSLLK